MMVLRDVHAHLRAAPVFNADAELYVVEQPSGHIQLTDAVVAEELIQSDKANGETEMNGHRILGLIAVVGLAKLAFGSHRHRMGPQARGNWQDRVAELHRELHRRDAEANAQPAAGPSADPA